MPQNEEPSVTQWACQCCTLVMANGECCEDHLPTPVEEQAKAVAAAMGWDMPERTDIIPDIHHGGDGKEPLSAIPEGLQTTLGMMAHNHADACPNYQEKGEYEYRENVECDCERIEFTWSSCDACGSNLGGERHAFVIWYPRTVA